MAAAAAARASGCCSSRQPLCANLGRAATTTAAREQASLFCRPLKGGYYCSKRRSEVHRWLRGCCGECSQGGAAAAAAGCRGGEPKQQAAAHDRQPALFATQKQQKGSTGTARTHAADSLCRHPAGPGTAALEPAANWVPPPHCPPAGTLQRDFKHLAVDMFLTEEEGQKVLKVDCHFGKRKALASIRTCTSHVQVGRATGRGGCGRHASGVAGMLGPYDAVLGRSDMLADMLDSPAGWCGSGRCPPCVHVCCTQRSGWVTPGCRQGRQHRLQPCSAALSRQRQRCQQRYRAAAASAARGSRGSYLQLRMASCGVQHCAALGAARSMGSVQQAALLTSQQQHLLEQQWRAISAAAGGEGRGGTTAQLAGALTWCTDGRPCSRAALRGDTPAGCSHSGAKGLQPVPSTLHGGGRRGPCAPGRHHVVQQLLWHVGASTIAALPSLRRRT